MRKNTKKTDIIIIAVILLLIVGGILLAVLPQNEQRSGNTVSAGKDGSESITYKNYIGKRIGIKTGSNFEPMAFEYLPDSEYLYFDSTSDLAVALEQNKIDAFLEDEPVARMLHSENSSLDYIKPPLINDDYSFMFHKGSQKSEKLLQQFNEMLAKYRESGKLDEITNRWFGSDESGKTFECKPFSGENGEIVVAGLPDSIPFSYYLNNEFTGCDVEIITDFALEYGYSIKFEQPNATAILAGIASGKYDIAIGSISVTEERKESADFSDTVYNGGVILMVRAEELSGAVTGGKVSVSDFNGKTAGVITGSMHDALIGKKLPDSQRLEFKNYSDLTEALLADKIDYFLMTRDGLNGLMAENDRIGYVDEPLDTLDVGAVFARSAAGSKIRAQFDEFITKAKADGTLDGIFEYWRSSEADGKSVDMSGLTGENGTLVFATAGDKPPVTYVASGSIAGTDPDIAVRFCREYGYDIKVEIADGGGLIPGVISGIFDFAMADLVITEERKENVDFSVPYSEIELFVTARKEDTVNSAVNSENTLAGNGTNFFESIASSFEKNFIREDRWKLIVEGIGTTCLITVLSAVFGSALAFLICMFRRTGSRLANGISDIYVRLMQGTPIVVLLMILYYVILGKSGLEAVWVAVIGFTLNFGAYASEIMRSGIGSIDGGQREAALALGYSENQAFFKFIFPQAAVRFIPVYLQEIVSLLKSTSVVGYIAIQDLTKMSDIIRSRTYEAFFPLIVTAIIYFILAWLISLILKLILKAFDKRGRAAK